MAKQTQQEANEAAVLSSDINEFIDWVDSKIELQDSLQLLKDYCDMYDHDIMEVLELMVDQL